MSCIPPTFVRLRRLRRTVQCHPAIQCCSRITELQAHSFLVRARRRLKAAVLYARWRSLPLPCCFRHDLFPPEFDQIVNDLITLNRLSHPESPDVNLRIRISDSIPCRLRFKFRYASRYTIRSEERRVGKDG